MTEPASTLKVAVGIATAGRPDILNETVRALQCQLRCPDRIVICAPAESDLGEIMIRPAKVDIYFGTRGLPAQRNIILDETSDCDVVLFLDDDFIPAEDYIAVLEKLHLMYPSVVMLTGGVLRDGVTTGGLPVAEAFDAIAMTSPSADATLEDVYNGYGCNMSVRQDVVTREHIRFDENLPLYGWLEDVDFSRSLARHGRIARSQALRGVHLGVKAGRQLGLRLGYSQVANPIYLLRKGNLSLRRTFTQIGRNISANLVRSFLPEPYIDRRGRVFGNILALTDLVLGRLSPQRILQF